MKQQKIKTVSPILHSVVHSFSHMLLQVDENASQKHNKIFMQIGRFTYQVFSA